MKEDPKQDLISVRLNNDEQRLPAAIISVRLNNDEQRIQPSIVLV